MERRIPEYKPWGKTSIVVLSPEVLARILTFLPVTDIITISETCKYLRQVVLTASEVWAEMLPPRAVDQTQLPSHSVRVSSYEDPTALSDYQISTQLMRVKATAQRGEYDDSQKFWLTFCPRRYPFPWAYVTFGNELQDIVWGDDERYWNRVKMTRSAVLTKVWWFDIATSWHVSKAGHYCAFVVLDPTGTNRREDITLGQLEMFAERPGSGDGASQPLGKMVGERNMRLMRLRGNRQYDRFVCISEEFVVDEDWKTVRVRIRDHNTTIWKNHKRFNALGLIPVSAGEEWGEGVAAACLDAYLEAMARANLASAAHWERPGRTLLSSFINHVNF